MRSIQSILIDDFEDIVNYNIFKEDTDIDCIKVALHILTVCPEITYYELCNHDQCEELLNNYMQRFGVNLYFLQAYADGQDEISFRDLTVIFILAEALWDLYVKMNNTLEKGI